MNSVLKYDRFILTKELNEKVKNIGECYEVANILESSFILRDARSKVAVGVVDFEDFDNHFVKEDNFKGWTPWQQMIGFDGQTDAYYRTNRRKTQVKFLTAKVRGESCCNKVNDFNLTFGIQTAYIRALNKAHEQKKAKLEKELKEINHEIAENNSIMKRMINSLEV